MSRPSPSAAASSAAGAPGGRQAAPADHGPTTPRVEFGRTARDYARHRPGLPERLFADLRARHGIPRPGQRILDLGTGTGAMARPLAAAGARVTGLDPSDALRAEAARLAARDCLQITWAAGTAEATRLPARAFEVVTAAQCWHWFDAPAACREIRRVLVPGGQLVLVQFDWLPRPGGVAALSERLITAHNRHWSLGGGTGLYPERLTALARGGFTAIESMSFDIDLPFTHADWRGRVRASAGVGASLAPAAIAAFDRAHATALAAAFPQATLVVAHRCFTIVARTPYAVPEG